MANISTRTQALAWATIAAATHIGTREQNEDNFLLQPWEDESALLAVVADGMGGNQGGEAASRLAIETFRELLNQPLPETENDRFEFLIEKFYRADESIREKGSSSFQLMGMGTTVVAALITPKRCLHLYAGDSRLYHFRDGQFYKTADHSIVRILIDIGKITPEQVATHPMRSVINSCLGGSNSPQSFSIDPKWDGKVSPYLRLEPKDIILLCTDGLHNAVTDATLQEIIHAYSQDIKQIPTALIEAALSREENADNITVLVVAIL